MLAWVRRLLRDPTPPPPRVVELAMRLADAEVAIDGLNGRLTDALKQINARITNFMKSEARLDGGTPQSSQDATGATIRPHVGYGQGQLPERRVRRNY